MKKICILYIQTSSKQIDFNESVNNYEKWTRIVTLNYIITNEHLDGFNYQTNHLIRPQGFLINKQTEIYNQIDNDLAINKGEDINEVLKKFLIEIENVDFFVGHNIDFHLNVLKSELIRNQLNDLSSIKTICLMKHGIEFCKLKNNNGYKFPTLEELYENLAGRKIKYSKTNYTFNIQLNAILKCYKILFKKNRFQNLELIPDRDVVLLNIPFKKDDFPKIKMLKVTQQNTNLYNITFNDIILFENIENLEIDENLGLYQFEKKMNIYNKTEYYIIDYRGVLVLKTTNRFLTIGYCPIYDVPAILIQGYTYGYFSFCYISHYINGILLHKSKRKRNFRSLDNKKEILVITHSKFEISIINNLNGNILFDRVNIIYDENLNYFIEIKENKAQVLSFDLKNLIYKFNLDGKSNLIFINQNKLLKFKKNGKTGIMEINGNEIIEPIYENILQIKNLENIFKFKKKKKHGIINISNKVIYEVEQKFKINLILDYYLIHLKNNLKGIIDKEGNLILDFNYDEINFINNELMKKEDEKKDLKYFELFKNNKRGLLLLSNNLLIPAIYKDIELKKDFIFIIDDDDKEGVLNLKGEIILECKYDFGKHYDYNNQFLEIRNNKNFDLINLHNKQYFFYNIDRTRRILKCNDFILSISKGGLVNYKNFSTNIETGFIYDDFNDLANFENDRQQFLDYYRFKDDRLIVQRNNLFGFLNLNLEETITCQYENAQPFINGKSSIINNDEMFYIDINGFKI